MSAALVVPAWGLVSLLAVLSASDPTGGVRHRLGRESLFAIFLASRLLPPVVTILPLYFLLQRTGLYDSLSGLTLAYAAANLPIAIWLLRGFILDIPVELEEVAQLDGASRLHIFFTLVVPLCRFGVAATSVVIFLLCWNEYLISVYLTADHAMTAPPFLASRMTTREQMAAAEPDDYARLAVVIILMLAPMAALTSVFQSVLVRLTRH